MGMVYAYITATAVYPDGREEYGWVDKHDLTDLQTNRNYVTPAMECGFNDEDLLEYAAEAVKDVFTAPRNNGDGTFYGDDEHVSFETGVVYTWALHFTHKAYTGKGANGWQEVPFVPNFDIPELMAPAVSPRVFHEL